VENKWINYHSITFSGESLSKNRDTHARCFLWRQNNPEVNCSTIRISGGGGRGRGRGGGGGMFLREISSSRHYNNKILLHIDVICLPDN
jgi:hypothetical protein